MTIVTLEDVESLEGTWVSAIVPPDLTAGTRQYYTENVIFNTYIHTHALSSPRTLRKPRPVSNMQE